MQINRSRETRDTNRDLARIQALRDAKFAKLDAQDARFKDQREAARRRLRADFRELVFRLFHPIKALQTGWKHKPARGSMLCLLYEADQANQAQA